MERNSNEKKHAIFVPLPLQGHINPFVQLSLKLASRGFSITFIVYEHIHQEMTQARGTATDIFQETRGSLDIRCRVVSDGLPLDFDRTGELEEYLDWYLNGGMYAQFEEAVGEIVLESNSTTVLVADTWLPWGSKIAKKFDLFHASFWTQPALAFNLYYHLHLLRDHAHFDCPDPCKEAITYIPGVESIDPKDLVSYLQEKDTSTNKHKLIFASFEDVRHADCVLGNTIQDLEPSTILALQTLMTFYPIGPIFRTKSSPPHHHHVPTSLWAESSCTEWLDRRPNGSVLFVSFGSLANFTKHDLLEIAYGLKLSNVGFVWVLRPRTVLHDDEVCPLPEGFRDCDRGLIVPWTDQISILSHRSIGGFLTHCGWNSVLESVWNRIPMLCFPLFGDQLSNRKLVVDDWRIGINLCDKNTLLKREDIAARIRAFMCPNLRDELCKSVTQVRKLLQDSLEMETDASSMKNLDMFTSSLNK